MRAVADVIEARYRVAAFGVPTQLRGVRYDDDVRLVPVGECLKLAQRLADVLSKRHPVGALVLEFVPRVEHK